MIFSVIIPTYRDTCRLLICLDALVDQDFSKDDFEVIVVNNDPEETLFLNPLYYDQLNLTVLSEIKPGSYASRNKGLSFASGGIIAFTDSDCIPDKEWLKRANKYYEKDLNLKIGILAGNVALFYRDATDLSPAEVYEKYTGFTQEKYAKEGHAITANWFSYITLIREVGGFNDSVKSNGDTDLSARISRTHAIVYAPDVIVRHPARYITKDIVYKYRRLLGGVYLRKYNNKSLPFLGHVINFNFRRFRFALKKIFTVPPRESWAILQVCVAINFGAWREYFFLIKGGETKR